MKVSGMKNTDLLEFSRKYQMLPPGSKVLCAVSGGADSICLLHILWTRREELKIEVAAAHYEHGIRGDESRRDAEFVRQFCEERNIEYIIGHGDVPAYAEKNSLGIEEAARILRYEFLSEASEQLKCSVIATAHNRDDNAETVLFHLARGGGTAGIRGIPPVRGKIIRPLLGADRRDIERYLSENGLEHVEDSSNASDDYSRNLIRHKIIPEIEKINQNYSLSMLRTSEIMRADEECLSALASDFISWYYDGTSFSLSEFRKLHRAVAGRVVRALCPQNLEYVHVMSVLDIAEETEQKFVSLPGVCVECTCGRMYFHRNPIGENKSACAEKNIPESRILPGEISVIPEAGLIISAEIAEYHGEVNDLLTNLYLKYDEICDGIFCTSRRAGDSIRPAGRKCTKTLRQLFLEAKVPPNERGLVPVLRDKKGVAAVLGTALDERFVPNEGCRVLHLSITK